MLQIKDEARLNNITDIIENINQRLNSSNPEPQEYERFDTPRPLLNNHDVDNNSSITNYDLDRDVIMKDKISAPLIQVPEPGFFSGKPSETELFCQLCEDTFRTTPNRYLSEETKINIVKSRRDSARNWYLTKYRDNIRPGSMHELLTGLKTAFSNVASYKLAKIKLMSLKQTYGKINDYIEEFRNYTRLFKWEEEPLTLIFYNGLHPRYQEEIQKLEVFLTTLESIITTCILLENSIHIKNTIKQSNTTKNTKKRNSNHHSIYKNNYKHYNNNYYKNHFNSRNHNNCNGLHPIGLH